MKKLAVILSSLLVSSICLAETPTVDTPAKKNSQQNKMVECNKEGTGKKGDERKTFMKSCLSASSEAAPLKLTQQEKMKVCNKDATGKKGDERKAFMKSCLSH